MLMVVSDGVAGVIGVGGVDGVDGSDDVDGGNMNMNAITSERDLLAIKVFLKVVSHRLQ